jgi:hypothetical protein
MLQLQLQPRNFLRETFPFGQPHFLNHSQADDKNVEAPQTTILAHREMTTPLQP